MTVRKRDVHLDIIRGSAAFLVMANHLRSFVFVDYPHLHHHSFWVKIFYFATSLGHQAVIVFFVLSGFLVGGGTYLRIRTRQWRWADYAVTRLSRLWIVLLPALCLTCFWDNWGIHMGSPYYGGAMVNILHSGPAPGELSLSLGTFMGNMFFLQTIFTRIYGTNGPLWSLANEFFYYLIFPCLVLIFYPPHVSRPLIYRLCSGAFAAMLALAVPVSILTAMVSWLLGAMVSLLKPHIFTKRSELANRAAMTSHTWKESAGYVVISILWLPMLIFVLAVLVLIRIDMLSPSINGDVLLGSALAFLILVLPERIVPAGNSFFYMRVSAFMADMSYSLYLTHFPFLGFLCTLCIPRGKLQFTISGMCIYAALAASALIYGFCVYWVFERRTPVLRYWLKQRLTTSSKVVSVY